MGPDDYIFKFYESFKIEIIPILCQFFHRLSGGRGVARRNFPQYILENSPKVDTKTLYKLVKKVSYRQIFLMNTSEKNHQQNVRKLYLTI